MGYDTQFFGQINVSPRLNVGEVSYLRSFSETRRVDRAVGPYYIPGRERSGGGVVDWNQPSMSQPGLSCQWVPNEDGTALVWDWEGRFDGPGEWMRYLIDTFLRPGATLAAELARPIPGSFYPVEFEGFTFDHVLNGAILVQGEEVGDRWHLLFRDNVVTTQSCHCDLCP